jgi:hypothetical protein
MSQETIIANTEVSFKDFLFKNKRNRTILWIAASAIVIQFSVFKYFYPFISYIHGDSFSYIDAAYENLSINTYLIGYSKFLRLFGIFFKSDFALAAFQYIFLQSTLLFLIFTIFYFYNVSKWAQYILICFIVLNPLFLHLGNLVSSDGFFVSLSALWFSLLIWVLNKPSNQILIWHAIVLFVAFSVRYNAMIYPLISTVVYIVSKTSLRNKILGLGLGYFLCTAFVIFTSFQYHKLTGYWQYSPFSGWQLANNAMYTYRYVDSSLRKPVPKKFERLDRMIREYFDSTRNTNKFPTESVMASTYYMWSNGMPLMAYRNKLFKKDTSATELKKWASMGPFYKSYGSYIIKKYPFHFFRYFVWPNANKYYAPPVEFLEQYNSGQYRVTKRAQHWFGYNSTKVRTRTSDNIVWILKYYPILSGIINIVMVCALLYFILLKGRKYNNRLTTIILLGSLFWVLNALFTIFASSAALRFQSFPIVVTTLFATLLIDCLVQAMRVYSFENKTNIENSSLHYKLRNEQQNFS